MGQLLRNPSDVELAVCRPRQAYRPGTGITYVVIVGACRLGDEDPRSLLRRWCWIAGAVSGGIGAHRELYLGFPTGINGLALDGASQSPQLKKFGVGNGDPG